MKHPEALFVVEVTAADEIVCRAPKQDEQRIKIADLGAVYVETNDTGPWGADVWWLLNDKSDRTKVAFPQMATGDAANPHTTDASTIATLRGLCANLTLNIAPLPFATSSVASLRFNSACAPCQQWNRISVALDVASAGA